MRRRSSRSPSQPTPPPAGTRRWRGAQCRDVGAFGAQKGVSVMEQVSLHPRAPRLKMPGLFLIKSIRDLGKLLKHSGGLSEFTLNLVKEAPLAAKGPKDLEALHPETQNPQNRLEGVFVILRRGSTLGPEKAGNFQNCGWWFLEAISLCWLLHLG